MSFAPRSMEFYRSVLKKKDFFGSFVTLLYQRSTFGTGESYSASTKNDLLTNAYEGLTLGHKAC